MTTNILSLPQLPAWEFVITTGADFRDSIQFIDGSGGSDVPLAITDIAFEATIRSAADSLDVLFEASTAAQTMTIDGPAGILSFAVPAETCSQLEEGAAIGDIVAVADGARINLSKDNGPLKFTVRVGLA